MATVGASRAPSVTVVFTVFMVLFFVFFFVGVTLGRKFPSADWQRLRLEHQRAKHMFAELSTCQESVHALMNARDKHLGGHAVEEALQNYHEHMRQQLADQYETCHEHLESSTNEEMMCQHQAEELFSELQSVEFVKEGGTNAQLLMDLAHHNATKDELMEYANHLKEGKEVSREKAVASVLKSLLRLRARSTALEQKCGIPSTVREHVASQHPEEEHDMKGHEGQGHHDVDHPHEHGSDHHV